MRKLVNADPPGHVVLYLVIVEDFDGLVAGSSYEQFEMFRNPTDVYD